MSTGLLPGSPQAQGCHSCADAGTDTSKVGGMLQWSGAFGSGLGFLCRELERGIPCASLGWLGHSQLPTSIAGTNAAAFPLGSRRRHEPPGMRSAGRSTMKVLAGGLGGCHPTLGEGCWGPVRNGGDRGVQQCGEQSHPWVNAVCSHLLDGKALRT